MHHGMKIATGRQHTMVCRYQFERLNAIDSPGASSYISSTMKRQIQRFSIFLLLFYVAAGFLTEITHTDDVALRLSSDPVVAQHECGVREKHIAMDARHECLACTHSLQRISVSFAFQFDGAGSLPCLASLPSVSPEILHADIFYSGKRGPPAA